jgi:hypothetical protein
LEKAISRDGIPNLRKAPKDIKDHEKSKEKAELFEQIGRLKMENEWLKKKLGPFD